MATSSPPARPSPPLLALFGPTASGKTAVAGVLRDRLGADVISADSAALYRDLPIITAAPEYPAQLVGTVPLTDDVSVGEYQRWAHAAIDAVGTAAARRRHGPVLPGCGLGARAAAAAEPGRRAHWQAEYDRLGSAAAHEELTRVDPAAAARVHANDRKRVVRALELAETGASLAPEHDRLWTEDCGRDPDRRARSAARGAGRPDRRTNARDGRGRRGGGGAPRLVDALSATARKVLGLEQFATLPEHQAVAEVALATRRLARYQRKWLRRMPGVVTLPANRSAEEVADEIVALASAGERLPRH